jgi:hypothetical protein
MKKLIARVTAPRGDDRGVAMLTAITVLAVLLAIGVTVTTLGVNNLQNASRDRQAGAALAASDAGVAQAIEYIRNNGLGALNCVDATASTTCTSNPAGWTNPINPQQVPLTSGAAGCTTSTDCAKVWIGTVRAFSPPTVKTGIYRVHSRGVFGNGPGARNVVVDLAVTPATFPIGVFGEQISGNGGTRVYSESLFARACIAPRETGSGNGTRFTGTDPYWGIPAAAHTTSHISIGATCPASQQSYVNTASAPCPDTSSNNVISGAASVLKYDQSGDGGPVGPSSACYHTMIHPDGTYFDSTKFTLADLQAFGYRPRGLSDAEYSALKSRAKTLGLYNVSVGSLSASITTLLASGVNQPVIYWDNGDVNLSYSDFPAGAFDRAPNGTCAARSVVVVVEHGDLTFQGGNNTWFDGSFFVPDGTWTGNGGYNVLGTMWANDVALGGNEQWQLDSCYVQNMPGPILNIKALSFREDDSRDVG